MTNITQFASYWKPKILVAVLTSAFVLSYAALFGQATAAGYDWWLGWAWPLLIDGVVLLTVISLAERQTRGLPTGFVWFVLIAFDAASIALNASYGWAISPEAALVHSLPAAVAPLALKLFTNDIKDAEAAKIAILDARKAAKVKQPEPANKAPEASKPAFGPQNLPQAHEAKASKIEARRSLVADLWKQGLSTSEIADAAKEAGHKASADTVRRDVKALGLSDDGPEIVDLFRVVKAAVNEAATNGNGGSNGH